MPMPDEPNPIPLTDEPLQNPEPRSGLGRYGRVYEETSSRLERVERWVAAVFGTLVSALFVCLLLLLNDKRIFGNAWGPLVFIAAMAIVVEAPFLYRLWSCARQGTGPIGPAVCQRTTPFPFPFRLFVIFWWLAHILVGLGSVITAEMQLIKQGMNNPILESLFSGATLFGMSICCNVFIAMFVKQVSGRDSYVESFWSSRLIVDALITITAISLA